MVRLNGALMGFLFDEQSCKQTSTTSEEILTRSDPRPFTYIKVMVQGKSDGGEILIMCNKVVAQSSNEHVSVGELQETKNTNMAKKYIFLVQQQ